MRLARPISIAAALAIPAAFATFPVSAHAPSGPHPVAPTLATVCSALQGEVDVEETRFACLEARGSTWAAWIEPPGPGTRDLVLTTVHVDPRGTRAKRTQRLNGAATWWMAIAPLVLRPAGEGVTIDVVRIGFQTYPVASLTRAP